MKFSAIFLAALVIGFADAKPTPTKTTPLEARGGGGGGGWGGNYGGGHSGSGKSSCSKNEFWYEKRSCCLPNGGPKVTPTPPSGIDCPSCAYFHPHTFSGIFLTLAFYTAWYFHHTQGCCVPSKPTYTPSPTCKSGWNWLSGLQCCQKGHTTTHVPTPSSNPKDKGKGKGKDKSKRNFEQWDASFCPTGLTTCPILANGVLTGDSEW